MTAGRGIQHAEMPVHKKGGVNPMGLQLWVDLPREKKMMEPNYQEQLSSEISTVKPSEDVEVRIISGESHGATGKVRSEGGCWYFVRISPS
jgi:redox-sensitive bicupin YhaK (pirin superfamily)